MLSNRIINSQCKKVEQPALRMNIILNGLQKLHCNSLTYIDPATEKRLDFVQRGVNKEMPLYSYKTPRKRKPPDKISFSVICALLFAIISIYSVYSIYFGVGHFNFIKGYIMYK